MVVGCFPGVVSAQPSYCPRWYRRADRDAWPKESVAIRVRKRRALSDTRNGRPLEKATYEASSFRPPFRFGVAPWNLLPAGEPTQEATTRRSHISNARVRPLWRTALRIPSKNQGPFELWRNGDRGRLAGIRPEANRDEETEIKTRGPRFRGGNEKDKQRVMLGQVRASRLSSGEFR